MLKNKKLFINQVSYGKWIIEQILSKWTCQFLKILDTILYVIQNIFFGGEKKMQPETTWTKHHILFIAWCEICSNK